VVEVQGLGKRYGWTWALRGVDLRMAPGEKVLVFGPNGAGKTTLFKLIAGIVRPSEGRIRIGGMDADGNPEAARRQVGFVGHRPFLYDDLTVRENLRFYGELYGIPKPSLRVDALLEWVGLRHAADLPARALSQGMAQRISVARALLHDPSVLLLDEPFSGVDPQGRAVLEGVLEEEGRTVLMATHDLRSGVIWTKRVLVLVRGRPKYLGPPPRDPEDLWRMCGEHR